MKEAIANVLQQWMDKCTSEQFWAVATLTGFNAFIISQKEDILAALPSWGVLVAVGLATAWGLYYIIHRHVAYYFLRGELVELLKNEHGIPVFLKTRPNKWRASSLTGVIFYAGWVLVLGAGGFVAYL